MSGREIRNKNREESSKPNIHMQRHSCIAFRAHKLFKIEINCMKTTNKNTIDNNDRKQKK